jgi:hypothetical protein
MANGQELKVRGKMRLLYCWVLKIIPAKRWGEKGNNKKPMANG